MPTFDYDFLVLGGGSGGVRAARTAAALGARTAIVEAQALGGTCVNVGCVPKKLMVEGSHYRELFDGAAGFGWHIEGLQFDWDRLREQRQREIGRLNDIYATLLEDKGVELVRGRARFCDPHCVEITQGQTQRRISGRYVLIATGSSPTFMDIPGAELGVISDAMFSLRTQPKRILIVGGGYIACEFAGIMHGFGSQTTLLYRGDQLLRHFDPDLGQHIAEAMQAKGITLLANQQLSRIESRDDALHCTLNNQRTLTVDTVLYAIGRHPNTAALNLNCTGVNLGRRGEIVVDDHYTSNVDHIFAVGDVINKVTLTPVALAEGEYVARHLFGSSARRVDYTCIPTAVFTQPTMATVGLSESQARAQYPEVQVYKSSFRPLKHMLSGQQERTLLKLVVDPASDRVLGAHMVGDNAAEIIQGLAIALSAGLTKAQLDATVGIHPTTAEEWVTLREPCS